MARVGPLVAISFIDDEPRNLSSLEAGCVKMLGCRDEQLVDGLRACFVGVRPKRLLAQSCREGAQRRPLRHRGGAQSRQKRQPFRGELWQLEQNPSVPERAVPIPTVFTESTVLLQRVPKRLECL